MKEYQGVGKFLQNLVESQEKNMVQLERIRAIVEWRWGLEGENEKEKSRDDEEGSEDGPRKGQEKRTLLSIFC